MSAINVSTTDTVRIHFRTLPRPKSDDRHRRVTKDGISVLIPWIILRVALMMFLAD